MTQAGTIAAASPPALSAAGRPTATALGLSLALHASLAAAALWWPHSSNDASLATVTVEVAFWPEATGEEPVAAAAAPPPEAPAEPVVEPPTEVASAEPPPTPVEPPPPVVEPPPQVSEALPAVEPSPPPKPRERPRAAPRPKSAEPTVAAAPPTEPAPASPEPTAPSPPIAARSAAQPAIPAPTQLAALPSATEMPSSPPLITQARFRSPPAPPTYPRRAIDLGQEGEVVIRALVGPDGESREIRIFRSSGVPLLDDAALRAVRRWAFEAAQINGRAIEAWVEVPVRFQLRTIL